jgi:hypothetical protein
MLMAAVVMGPFALSGTANASLVGSPITGGMYYYSSPGVANTSTNYFIPQSGTFASFGYNFGSSDGSVTADFTLSTLTITKVFPVTSGIGGDEFVFTDPAFSDLSVLKTQDSFDNGGVTAQLVGDTLTLNVGPNCISPGAGCSWTSTTESAQFSLSLSPVPIPASLPLLASGFLGIIFYKRAVGAHLASFRATSLRGAGHSCGGAI